MTTLPVSGLAVRCRVPDGRDDLAVLEARGPIVEQALAVLERLVMVESDAFRGWVTVTVTDYECALLLLRQFLFGDAVGCLFRCIHCGERMEVEFSVSELLAESRPRVSRQHDGWLSSNGGRFRLPCVEDQLHIVGNAHPHLLLAERCIESGSRARAERAMAAMAPVVSRPVEGRCQACSALLSMPLYVPALVVDELRMAAAGVHEEIHWIAEAYHWSEAAILDLPQSRRQAYAATIERQRRLTG